MTSQLRETRDMREIVREEPLVRNRILAALAGGPKTVPELAEAIGYPSHEVMVWVMAMRRYGYVRDLKETTGDGYFRYAAVERENR